MSTDFRLFQSILKWKNNLFCPANLLYKAWPGELITQFSRRQLLATIQESPHFVAPEVVLGTAEGTPDLTKVDVWSLGVILFAMLCGRLPFIHPQMKSLCKLIVASPYAEPDFVSDGTEAPHTDGLLTPQNALISFAACSASARKTAPQWRMSCSEFFFLSSLCRLDV